MKKETSAERIAKLGKTIRKVWIINPKTRVKPAKRIYKRRKEKQSFRKELEDER